jgi:hypothetical protein
MKGLLKGGPAADHAVEAGDPPIRRGIIVLGDRGFGEEAHRSYPTKIDPAGAVYTHGGPVHWPPEAGPVVVSASTPGEDSLKRLGRDGSRASHPCR